MNIVRHTAGPICKKVPSSAEKLRKYTGLFLMEYRALLMKCRALLTLTAAKDWSLLP